MTDEQIIKALGLCSSENLGCEDGCPCGCNGLSLSQCRMAILKKAFALIKRQKAEIERLKIRNDELNALNKSASIEAIKEFAERLTEKATSYMNEGSVSVNDIDNLAKELTE